MAESEYMKDLLALQREVTNPGFDKVNPMFKSQYTSLATVLTHARAHCSKHNFVLAQNVTSEILPDSGAIVVEVQTQLLHVSGAVYEAGVVRIVPGKPDAHGIVGASTYARRVGVLSALAIAGDDDDDGNSAVASAPKAKPQPVASPAAWDKLNASTTYEEFKAAWGTLTTDERKWVTDAKKAELDELRKRLPAAA